MIPTHQFSNANIIHPKVLLNFEEMCFMVLDATDDDLKLLLLKLSK